MSRSPAPFERPPTAFRAVLRYTAVWLVLGAIAVVSLFVVLREQRVTVELPPVRATELNAAVAAAGCTLRRGAGHSGEPSIDGPPVKPVAPGVYDDPQPDSSLVGALRRGIIVIYYRPDLDGERREQLGTVQAAVPEATIVTPYAAMRYEIAVAAWRRLLGCATLDDDTLDAVRLFRGRFLGSGPEAPRGG